MRSEKKKEETKDFRSSAFPGMGLFPFLLASLLLMKGALGQEWGVWYNNDDLTAQEDSNISIPCSYRYPNRQQVSKTMWYKYNNIIVYHSDAQQIHSFYKARTWYHEDKNRDCTLQITNLRMEDSGWYYFRFWTNNDYYYSGSFVKLTVTENPCWASINSPNIFEEEKMVTVICSVRKSSNVPYWSYNSTDISEQTYSPPYYINIILRLIPSRHDHGRVLFCRRPGCLDKELKLNIWYSPDGVQLYSSSNIQSPVDAGQNVTLRCEVSSSNPPVTRYSWYKNGTELVTSAQNLLLFESIKASDSGIYHCVVHNEIGNSSSQPISINVACSSCVAVFPAALGAVAVLLVLLTIGIGTLFYMRSRKRREAVRSASISTHIYDNVTILPERNQEEKNEHISRNSPNLGAQDPQEYFTHISSHHSGTERSSEGLNSGTEDPGVIYSQVQKQSRKSKTLTLPGCQRQEVQAPEEVHYSTIQHGARPAKALQTPQEDSGTVYANMMI
ncbi:sialoadhesin isoform X5 [Microcaecilia unicolor]|uniref:Sialoadhesin-like isoform X5 n=1 Tax=Microcaecilia unicolor TaxID=1415580 RepID=A0A6P7YNI3_9AMPH|nr:sialoadhesin-like isoform X5 [Microcaecilia unicolor]